MKIIITILFIISLTYSTPPWMLGESKAEDLEIKLVTIGPGDELTTWWGHNAVIVEDVRLQVAKFYNYGLFSFDQDNFLLNFARGRLIFWVGVSDAYKDLIYYASLNRNIRVQILDISPKKKLEMAVILAINVLPQNRYYLYDHYNDNCATRVRDLIDKIVEGQFLKSTQNTGRLTLRQHTRRFTYHHFLMDWILMFFMGDTIDKPISKWQEMFLPAELELKTETLYYDNDLKNKKPFVKESYTYYEAQDRDPVPYIPPGNMVKGVLLGTVLAALAIILTTFMLKQTEGKIFKKIFGYYNSLIGLLFGLPGLILFFLNICTDHSVTYYNENLFLANPLTILLIPLGIMYGYQNRLGEKWLPLLWYAHAFLGILLLVLKILPAFDQDNGLFIISILPVTMAFCGCFFFLAQHNINKDIF
jgi:hypothetical protein